MTWKPILVVVLCLSATVAAGGQPGEESSSLSVLLERLDRNASTYREYALKFSCEETIRWSGLGEAGREKFGYVFIYDEDDGFTDYRTRSRHRGGKVPRRVTPAEFRVPRFLGSAYLWMFTFRQDRWPHHEYELIGEDSVLDRPAVKLKFSPISPITPGVNDWHGTAWIDVETAQLLKVEAYSPDDHNRLQAMRRHSEGDTIDSWTYEIETMTTWFETEVGSLRFPSRVELRRVSHQLQRGKKGWKIVPERLLRVDQSYGRYEFFGVKTTEKLGTVIPQKP